MSLTAFSIFALTLVAASGDNLCVYESKYYIIETELSAERAAFIGKVMDTTGKEYFRRFQGFRGFVRRKPKVRVYADKDRYIAALARACGEPNTNTRGYYCGLDEIVYTYEGDGLERILKHECFHQFAEQTVGGRLPRWTHEGLAEYFEEGIFDVNSGQLRLGAVPAWRLAVLREAQKEKALFSVDRLLHMRRSEWRDNMRDRGGRVQYSQVWLLCHFLIHGDGGRYVSLFDEYLRHLDRGLDPDSAFKRVFGADTRPLDTKLHEYLDALEPEETKP